MKKNTISIIGGAGRAGLPLSLMLASKNCKTIIIDVDLKKLDILKKGIMPFKEEGSDKLLKKYKKKIIFTNNYNYIKKSEIIILTTETPVDNHFNPEINKVEKVIDRIIPFLSNNQTLILRSTLYPGTSKMIDNYLKKKNLKINLSFCPERISQGYGIKELKQIPQIISGNNLKAILISKKVFSKFIKKFIVINFEEAEVSKLFSNAWRYIKFSIANEFYKICVEKKLDFEIIRNAVMKDYPRAKDFPRSGFTAGPCLFKDTMQLTSYSRDSFSLGHNSMLINETLPNFLINKFILKNKLKNINVGILGMTFKPDNDDIRESLAYKLKKILEFEGAKVYCSDIYLKNQNKINKFFVDEKKLLKKCKIIFIGSPHKLYKKLKFSKKHKVIDCWGFLKGKNAKKNFNNWS